MKARIWTAQQLSAMTKVTDLMVKEQAGDIELRTLYAVCAAMFNVGLSARTINRVLSGYEAVQAAHKERRRDGLADFAILNELERRGVSLPMTTHEM